MHLAGRFTNAGKGVKWIARVGLAAVAGLVFALTPHLDAQAPPPLEAVTDRMTYNVGEQVGLRLVSPARPEASSMTRESFDLRYEGQSKPVAEGLEIGVADSSSPGYRILWKVPLDAPAGRYDIDLHGSDSASSHIASFVVHRQEVQIVSAAVSKPYYTSGDVIGCSVKIENLGGRLLTGLRLEFSERYWPWIVQQRERVGAGIETVQTQIALRPHQQLSVDGGHCAVAADVAQPSYKQYVAVLWDGARQNVSAISFTPLVFVNPPGVGAPHPYPPQYIYPSLGAVDTTNYRRFHPQPYGADAIQFDTQHTMFRSGDEATVRFSLANVTSAEWHKVTVRIRLLRPDGTEQASQVIAESLDLHRDGPRLNQEMKFPLAPNVSGIYQAQVEIVDAAGQIVAGNTLELGVNPLPSSVLLFCAHEDDDGTQMGFIRALVENQVPYHMVYFTSGDAGSCDRYFQHPCGPSEALNFGGVRMQEARAAMGHLGVPPENIYFLGLPDGGTGKIWFDHQHSSDPYLAVLLASDHAPYDGIFRPNLPYARDAVVGATEELIKRFQPAVIFTVHPPAEGHIDHIVTNYFVVKALQELRRQGVLTSDVELRVDRIFNAREHPSTPYHYEDHPFHVSGDAMALAQEAEWFYESQGGNQAEGRIRDWSKLPRSEGYRKVLDWKEHEGWNDKE